MSALFFIIAVIAILSAIGVVLFPQPLYSAFCLVANLLAVAVLYAMMDAHFLAAVQVIVYAGAILVLVVFLIMLLSLGATEKRPIPPMFFILGVASAVGFLSILIPLLTSNFSLYSDEFSPGGSVVNFGKVLFTDYVFAFEAASLLIMAGVVGAVALAKSSQSEPQKGQGGEA